MPSKLISPAHDGLPTPQRYWATLTVLIGLSLAILDASIINVALPSLSSALNVLPAQSLLIVNAYYLTVVMLLFPSAALAERFGFKRIFTWGLIIFTIASLACALSQTLHQLVFARILQGVGASSLMCLFAGLTKHIYPSHKLGLGLSLNATMVGVMSVVGPSIGSVILHYTSWPWLFSINIPLCLLALLGTRFLPNIPRSEQPYDVVSALLSMATLGLFIISIDRLNKDITSALGLVCLSLILGYLLFIRSKKFVLPLIPIDLLRIKPLSFALGASVATFACQTIAFIALPFYFQNTLQRPLLEVGTLVASWSIGTIAIAIIAGRLSDKYSPAILCGTGASVIATCLLILTSLPASTDNMVIRICLFGAGLGFGLFQTPNNRSIVSSAPKHRLGAIGGLQSTTRVFGQNLGAALTASIFAHSQPPNATFALYCAMACGIIAMGVNLIRYRA